MKKLLITNLIVILLFIISKNSYSVALSIPDTSGEASTSMTIPILFSDSSNSKIAGADLLISYNPDILDVISVNSTTLTSGFLITDSISSGNIAISLARATGIAETYGIFLEIDFQIKSDAIGGSNSPLTFNKAYLYDESANVISTEVSNGSISVIGDDIKEEDKITVLPNPFTPNNDSYNDNVTFNLSPGFSSGQTEIQIFDVSGKSVRKIRQDLVWDGLDNDGKALKPGVYIYILKINGETKFNGTITLIR